MRFGPSVDAMCFISVICTTGSLGAGVVRIIALIVPGVTVRLAIVRKRFISRRAKGSSSERAKAPMTALCCQQRHGHGTDLSVH